MMIPQEKPEEIQDIQKLAEHELRIWPKLNPEPTRKIQTTDVQIKPAKWKYLMTKIIAKRQM